jgi:hypothetical protein
VGVLFLGTLDAFDLLCGVLRRRVSQQAFSLLRFQMESLAIVRWLTESPDPGEKQFRSYQVSCGQVRRFGTFMMKDAGRDKSALNQVKAVRDWGVRLRDIAREDGMQRLKGEPNTPQLLIHKDVAGYPTYKMYSELGSHPGTAGFTLFAIRSGSESIRYDLQGSVLERGFLVSTSLVYQWKIAQAASAALGWGDWLSSDGGPTYLVAVPLMSELSERRKSLASQSGL